ncbi:MAG: imidazole glycerol phosphate synthase subunit HisH, partial [Cyanobacteria bacterium PR.3.49]|nr:imidazole glycerol phosphate synthase subunit HisH [Cyanobacteria bacterium PR.3.49]
NLVNPSNLPDGSRPIILPGVGNFGAVMKNLQKEKFDQKIKKLVEGGTPYLGICVGMQILFDSSEESDTAGLGILPGRVLKFTAGKVPQIGWNLLEAKQQNWPNGFVYFVNSYFARPESDADVLYTSDYFGDFCAAVRRDNITAFQFHPEKSGEFGQQLLVNWLKEVSISVDEVTIPC